MEITGNVEESELTWRCKNGHDHWNDNTFHFRLVPLDDRHPRLRFTQNDAVERSDEDDGNYNFNSGYVFESVRCPARRAPQTIPSRSVIRPRVALHDRHGMRHHRRVHAAACRRNRTVANPGQHESVPGPTVCACEARWSVRVEARRAEKLTASRRGMSPRIAVKDPALPKVAANITDDDTYPGNPGGVPEVLWSHRAEPTPMRNEGPPTITMFS
jgi:hypothetical protein